MDRMTALRRFRLGPGGPSGPDLVEAFDEDGFLVIEGFASPEACASLRRRMTELIDDFDPSSVATVFSATDQRHASDRYFRDSGDKIRFFFEEGAFDTDGRLVEDKHQALNKVGHALHDLDPVFSAFCRDERLARLANVLGLADPGLMQSMYIFKPPFIGGEVDSHQDATFLYTEPQSCLGLWFALEDATAENGCLFASPGTHRAGLKQRFHENAVGDLVMETVDPTPLPDVEPVALEAPAGTLVVLHGLLPHHSGPNLSPVSRHAFALHLIDRACRWAPDNWLKRSADMPVRGFN